MALNATAKDPDANSYCDDDFAQAYFEVRVPNKAWADHSDLQENALITATNRLEQEKFRGARTTSEQALKFPRTGLLDDDDQAVDPDEVPIEVMRAQCEEAYAILAAGTSDIMAGTGLEPFKALAVGPIKLEMRDPDIGDSSLSLALGRSQLPFQVQRLLRNWLITDVDESEKYSGWGTTRLSKS